LCTKEQNIWLAPSTKKRAFGGYVFPWGGKGGYDVIFGYKNFLRVDLAKNVFTYMATQKNVSKKQIKAGLFILKYSNVVIILHFCYTMCKNLFSSLWAYNFWKKTFINISKFVIFKIQIYIRNFLFGLRPNIRFLLFWKLRFQIW
jgi:hypothetical protein